MNTKYGNPAKPVGTVYNATIAGERKSAFINTSVFLREFGDCRIYIRKGKISSCFFHSRIFQYSLYLSNVYTKILYVSIEKENIILYTTYQHMYDLLPSGTVESLISLHFYAYLHKHEHAFYIGNITLHMYCTYVLYKY